MFFWKISKIFFFRYSYSFWKDLSRAYLIVSKFLSEEPKFKKNDIICVITVIKVRDFLLTLLPVISILAASVPNILYQAFVWHYFLQVDFLRSLSVSIASSQQSIIKMKFIINVSNIPYCLWAGLCCLRINSFTFLHIIPN